jgi:hypothetical protein
LNCGNCSGKSHHPNDPHLRRYGKLGESGAIVEQ